MNSRSRARLYGLFSPSLLTGRTWLDRLPPALFAISVGLFGLLGAWRRARASGWEPAGEVADFLIWPTLGIWGISLLLYAAKCKRHPHVVLQEFRHPVQGSLLTLAPLSLLLAVSLFGDREQGFWLLLTMLALGLNAVIAFRVVSVLANGQMPSSAVTPALYLPIVGGSLIGALALASLDYRAGAAMLFGTGVSGWAFLEARILSVLFSGPMPAPLRPTIGVELAPPLITTLCASMIWPQLPGEVLIIGLGVAIGPAAGVAARYRHWSSVPFSVGFWSFSFPLAALATVAIEVTLRGGWPLWIGYMLLIIATGIIAVLTLRTLLLLLQRRFLAAP